MTTAGSSEQQGVASASDALRAIAGLDPERTALEVGASRLSYAELDAQAESAAAALVDRLGPGRHHVVLFIEGTRELLIASMAIARAGFVSVPVDPTVPHRHLLRIVEDVEAALVISDLPDVHGKSVDVLDPRALVGSRPTAWTDVPPGEYVSIAFTSGSTGEPKGIVIPSAQRPVGAGGVDNSVYGTFAQALRGGLIAAGSTSVVETTVQNYVVLGATIVAYEIRREGVGGFADWLRQAEVFGFGSVPTVLRHLVATLEDDETVDSVRMLFVTGETVTWDDARLLRRHFPEAVVMSIFGTTETGPCLVFAIDSTTELGQGPLPLGLPMPGRTIEIVRPDGRPAEGDEVGEIVVTGRETSLSYWRRPVETAGAFTAVGGELRRVRTGDLGRWLPDGNVAHHGRRDHVVKISGNRVELGQVESALRSLAGVREAAATTYVDHAGELRLVASVVPADGETLHPGALRIELARRLPGPMLPDSISVLEGLPLLPGGKIDRRRLPVTRIRESITGYVAPSTGLERELRSLWVEILGVDDISVEDDFFLLGGDSLRGARVIVELNRRFGVDLPVSVLVEAPTIRAFAELLEARGSEWSPVVPVRIDGDRPPLFIVHDGTGEVVFAHPIAREIPTAVPVYGLRGRVLDGNAIEEQSIEALASRYVEAVRAVRPIGPYCLYGMSVGGTIAFEMARQLEAAGEHVPVLALGDTPGPGGYRPQPDAEPASVRARRRLAELRAQDPLSAVRYAAHLSARQARFRAGRLVAQVTGEDARREKDARQLVEAAAGGPPVPMDMRKSFALHVYGLLAVGYVPDGPHEGPLTILRSRKSDSAIELWEQYVNGPVKVAEIEGAHTEFGREPVVGQVGRCLATAIRSAFSES